MPSTKVNWVGLLIAYMDAVGEAEGVTFTDYVDKGLLPPEMVEALKVVEMYSNESGTFEERWQRCEAVLKDRGLL